MVSTDTIDLISQAAYKYRVISKRERTLFGRMLWLVNQQGLHARYGEPEPTLAAAEFAYPEFTRFERKFKRLPVAGALACFAYQACEAPTWDDSEVKRLLDIVADKNAHSAGYRPTTEWQNTLDADGNIQYHPEDEEDYDANEDTAPIGEYVVTESAASKYLAAHRNSGFWDITPAQRDPESEDFEGSVMVRPITVIQAERELERERIMAERTAQLQQSEAEQAAREAEQAAREAADGDGDEEEWDDVDDEFVDEDEDETAAPVAIDPDPTEAAPERPAIDSRSDWDVE
ncbi:MAG: hypothetical protein DRQ55_16115 [Planctomycetota bacterium]|nr:MAG: hypothetical protein DRQ55_16115 [Planctomycetota bacterium]